MKRLEVKNILLCGDMASFVAWYHVICAYVRSPSSYVACQSRDRSSENSYIYATMLQILHIAPCTSHTDLQAAVQPPGGDWYSMLRALRIDLDRQLVLLRVHQTPTSLPCRTQKVTRTAGGTSLVVLTQEAFCIAQTSGCPHVSIRSWA